MIRQPHELARLIDEAKEAQGISDQDISDRAARKRLKISKQLLSAIRTDALAGPMRSIYPGTLEAIAAGTNLPLARVVEAAILSAGLPLPATPADWSIESAIEHDLELPLAAKRMLLSMVAEARSGVSRPKLGEPVRGRRAARASERGGGLTEGRRQGTIE